MQERESACERETERQRDRETERQREREKERERARARTYARGGGLVSKAQDFLVETLLLLLLLLFLSRTSHGHHACLLAAAVLRAELLGAIDSLNVLVATLEAAAEDAAESPKEPAVKQIGGVSRGCIGTYEDGSAPASTVDSEMLAASADGAASADSADGADGADGAGASVLLNPVSDV